MRKIESQKGKNRNIYYIGESIRKDARRIGHRLSLAMSEDEDAELWRKYQRASERWKAYKLRSGFCSKDDDEFRERTYYKPIFDETYLRLTQELAELYRQMDLVKRSSKERVRLVEEIRAKRQERRDTAHFVDRETGLPVDEIFSEKA